MAAGVTRQKAALAPFQASVFLLLCFGFCARTRPAFTCFHFVYACTNNSETLSQSSEERLALYIKNDCLPHQVIFNVLEKLLRAFGFKIKKPKVNLPKRPHPKYYITFPVIHSCVFTTSSSKKPKIQMKCWDKNIKLTCLLSLVRLEIRVRSSQPAAEMPSGAPRTFITAGS